MLITSVLIFCLTVSLANGTDFGSLNVADTNPSQETDDPSFGPSRKVVNVRATYDAPGVPTGHAIHAASACTETTPTEGACLGITGGVEIYNANVEAWGSTGYVDWQTSTSGAGGTGIVALVRGNPGATANVDGVRSVSDSVSGSHPQSAFFASSAGDPDNSFRYGLLLENVRDNGLLINRTQGSGPEYPYAYVKDGVPLWGVDKDGVVIWSSDERLKDVEGEFQRGLAAVLPIRPIVFGREGSDGSEVGFSWQNVSRSLPEATLTTPNGDLVMTDRPLIAAMVNSIQELNERMTELEQQWRSREELR